MTARWAAALALALGGLLLADDGARQKVQVTETRRMEFPAGGVLHLEKSFGEVAIEGWDQPQVEMTTIKSTPVAYAESEREQASRLLQKVRITMERQGNEVVVATTAPGGREFLHLSALQCGSKVDLDYRIKVPRQARLVVRHGAGEVHVSGVTGDIRATVAEGEITLQLPREGRYSIDAKSGLGDIVSDFPGRAWRRPWIFAHGFVEEASPAAHKLYLRVGFGDIIILKTPATPPPGQ